jgi:hypothetical protein
VALPPEAPAGPAQDTEKAYAAFFLGLGDYVFSWGIPLMESEARKLGFETDVFAFSDMKPAWTNIVRKRKDGYKIAVVGYSLGNSTATYLQRHLAIDLLLAISESSLARNYPIERKNTKRSVLWYGPDVLSNAGVRDGFDEINYIESLHLMMPLDPRVVRGVLDELKSLIMAERRDQQLVARNAHPPKPIAASVNDKIVMAPTPQLSSGWLPPTNVITPDVTCSACWGFTQSLDAAGAEFWME